MHALRGSMVVAEAARRAAAQSQTLGRLSRVVRGLARQPVSTWRRAMCRNRSAAGQREAVRGVALRMVRAAVGNRSARLRRAVSLWYRGLAVHMAERCALQESALQASAEAARVGLGRGMLRQMAAFRAGVGRQKLYGILRGWGQGLQAHQLVELRDQLAKSEAAAEARARGMRQRYAVRQLQLIIADILRSSTRRAWQGWQRHKREAEGAARYVCSCPGTSYAIPHVHIIYPPPMTAHARVPRTLYQPGSLPPALALTP